MDEITAKFKNLQHNGRNYGGEKEMVTAISVIGQEGRGQMKEIIAMRLYMGRSRSASTVYASIWLHGRGYDASGRGSAGGYGYHKESAALQDAVSSAGIELDHYIDGLGDQAMDEALGAIARAMGYRKFVIVRHG